jgi:predicted AlkP superfamily pyrophosphatase or phosphodiesterase
MKSKILVIGIDGLNLASALESSPTIADLKKSAFFTELTMQVPTWSGPSWSTLLTGSTHEQHGVRDNSFSGHQLLHRPDLLSLAYYQDQSTTTFAAAGWPPLVDPSGHGPVIQERREQQKAYRHRVIIRDGERYGYTVIDSEIHSAAMYAIENHGPDVSFVYFCSADETAHVFGSVGGEYRAAIARIDIYVENLLTAVRSRASAGEPWLVVITTDHGHLDRGGHGGDTPQERASFVIAAGIGRSNPDWPQEIEPHELTPLLLAERA